MASLRDEIGDFVGIPVSFVEDDTQTAESRLVFMILRYHTNRKRKRAFPGFETIMRETGLSRQKTSVGVKVLAQTGWLVKHRRFGQAMEYELRYPVSRDSSTMELSRSATIVPPANDDSSTMERTSLDINNKIEFNQIPPLPPVGRGYKQPPKPLEETSLNPPSEFPVTDSMYVWLAEMCFSFSEQELVDAMNAWRDSRESKPHGRARTVAMWQADWKKFIRIYWEIRQRNGNGANNGKPKQFETAAERNKRNLRESLKRAGIVPRSGERHYRQE